MFVKLIFWIIYIYIYIYIEQPKMTCQNTQKSKHIVTIKKKIKHQLKWNWKPCMVEAWKSSQLSLQEIVTYTSSNLVMINQHLY